MSYEIIYNQGVLVTGLESFESAVAKLEELKAENLIGSHQTGVRIVEAIATFDAFLMDKESKSAYPDENRAEYQLAQAAKQEILEEGDLDYDAVYGRREGKAVRLVLGSNMYLDLTSLEGELSHARLRVSGFETAFNARFEGKELYGLEDAVRHHLER